MQDQDIQSTMRAAEELVEQTRQALRNVDEIYAHVGVDPARLRSLAVEQARVEAEAQAAFRDDLADIEREAARVKAACTDAPQARRVPYNHV
ncbi:type III secretion system chaperone Btc22 [Bordetella bronchiseptica]